MSCVLTIILCFSVITMASKAKITCDTFKSDERFYQNCISDDELNDNLENFKSTNKRNLNKLRNTTFIGLSLFFLIILFAFIYHPELNGDKKICGSINFIIQLGIDIYYLFLLSSLSDSKKEYEEVKEKFQYESTITQHKNYKYLEEGFYNIEIILYIGLSISGFSLILYYYSDNCCCKCCCCKSSKSESESTKTKFSCDSFVSDEYFYQICISTEINNNLENFKSKMKSNLTKLRNITFIGSPIFFLVFLFAFIYHPEINDDRVICGSINFLLQLGIIIHYCILQMNLNKSNKEYEEERNNINYYTIIKEHKNYQYLETGFSNIQILIYIGIGISIFSLIIYIYSGNCCDRKCCTKSSSSSKSKSISTSTSTKIKITPYDNDDFNVDENNPFCEAYIKTSKDENVKKHITIGLGIIMKIIQMFKNKNISERPGIYIGGMILELIKYYKNECYLCKLKSLLEYHEKVPQQPIFFVRFFLKQLLHYSKWLYTKTGNGYFNSEQNHLFLIGDIAIKTLREYEWDTFGAPFGIVDRYHVEDFEKVYAYHIVVYSG